MINGLLRSFLIHKTNTTLTKDQKDIIIHDIEMINFKRMKLFLYILLIVEILFITFNDLPSLKNGDINWIWSDIRYFIIHILLSILSFVGIILINIIVKNDTGIISKFNRMFIPGLTMVMLVLVSILNGLDQIKTDHGSSVFIANLLICSAVLIIKFPISLFVYFTPFVTFIIELVTFQKDSALLYSNIINGIIFFIAVIIISKTTYDSQFDQMSKNIKLKEINEKLDFISNYDPLTGLLNRRNFAVRAKQNLELSSHIGKESALILIDIDHFKYVNDNFGHPVGDMVLKEVSNILVDNLKDSDLAARWGGEEFLLLISSATIDEAYQLSNKIREIIEKRTLIIDKSKIKITASFGVSSLTGSFSTSFNTSYTLADNALYKAKNSGRNQVVVITYNKEEDSLALHLGLK